MASVFPLSRIEFSPIAMPGGRRLARGMSRHAAAALLGFTGLQAWLALALADQPGGRLLPLIALALLMLGAMPLARNMERRWQSFAADALPCPRLLSLYRRDRARLWAAATLVPPLVMIPTVLLASLIR